MADDPTFFLARAEEQRKLADAATLDNVRDRCRRAEAAWTEMARRANLTRTMREAREAETAATREAAHAMAEAADA